MNKILLLTLIVISFAEELRATGTPLTKSGIESIETQRKVNISDLPQISTLFKSTTPSPQPSTWNFTNNSLLGNQAKWVYPSDSFKLYDKYTLHSFTITFYTDCPQQAVVLYLAATGKVFVKVNDNDFLLTWGNAYPQTIHTLTIPPKHLLCGCNKITVFVYNYEWIQSPNALIFIVSQDTSICYNCDNLGVTFYNRQTCQCECVSECKCDSGKLWYDYPICGCKCRYAQTTRCKSTHYFNYQTCVCSCNPKCCDQNYHQDQDSCVCVKDFILSGGVQILDSNLIT